jgi:hypothetical protein
VPLLGQGDDLPCKRLLPGHAAVKELLGFLASGKTASGRQTKSDASRIVGRAQQAATGAGGSRGKRNMAQAERAILGVMPLHSERNGPPRYGCQAR